MVSHVIMLITWFKSVTQLLLNRNLTLKVVLKNKTQYLSEKLQLDTFPKLFGPSLNALVEY